MTLRTAEKITRKAWEEIEEQEMERMIEEARAERLREAKVYPSSSAPGTNAQNALSGSSTSSSTATARIPPPRSRRERHPPAQTTESFVPTTASVSESTARSTRSRARTSRSNTQSLNEISPDKPLTDGKRARSKYAYSRIPGRSESSDSSDLLDTIRVEDQPLENGEAGRNGKSSETIAGGEEGTEDGSADIGSASSQNSPPYVPKPTRKPGPTTKITLTFGRKRKAAEAGLPDGEKNGKIKPRSPAAGEGSKLKPKPSASTSPEASSRISILEDITTEAETNDLLNRLREFENGVEKPDMSRGSSPPTLPEEHGETDLQSTAMDWGKLDANGCYTMFWDKDRGGLTSIKPEGFVHPCPMIEEPRGEYDQAQAQPQAPEAEQDEDDKRDESEQGQNQDKDNVEEQNEGSKRAREETDPLTEPEDEEPGVEASVTMPVVQPLEGVPMSRETSRNAGRRAPRKKRKWLKKGEVDPDDPIAVARQKERHMMIDQALENLDRQFKLAQDGKHDQLLAMLEELDRRREWQLARLEERYKATLSELAWVANHEADGHMQTWESDVLAIKDTMARSNEHKQWLIEDQKACWKRKPNDFKYTRVGSSGGGWMVYDEHLLSKNTLPVVPTFLEGKVRERVQLTVKPVMLDPTTVLDDLKVYDVRQPRPRHRNTTGSHTHTTQSHTHSHTQTQVQSSKPIVKDPMLPKYSRTTGWVGHGGPPNGGTHHNPNPDPNPSKTNRPEVRPQQTTATTSTSTNTPASTSARTPTTASAAIVHSQGVRQPTTATGSIPHAPQPRTATAAPTPTTNGTTAQTGTVAPMGSRWLSGQKDTSRSGQTPMAPPTTNAARTNGTSDQAKQSTSTTNNGSALPRSSIAGTPSSSTTPGSNAPTSAGAFGLSTKSAAQSTSSVGASNGDTNRNSSATPVSQSTADDRPPGYRILQTARTARQLW